MRSTSPWIDPVAGSSRLLLNWCVAGCVLLALCAGARAADGLAPPRPLDAATQAAIEQLAREAADMIGAPKLPLPNMPNADQPGVDLPGVDRQGAGATALQRAQEAARAVAAAPEGNAPLTLPEALQRATAAAQASSRAGEGAGTAPGAVSAPPPEDEPVASPSVRPLILFVSSSMGESDLAVALAEAGADRHTRVVLRGVLPGERLGDAVRRLAPLLRDHADRAAIEIDPSTFRKADVASVPTIYDPATGSMWRGSVSLAGFRERLARRSERFSEQVGPQLAIVEPDLVAVMQAQAARLDFTGMQERAYRDFWGKVALLALPTHETGRERLVDPTVVLPAPLRDGDGRVLVAAGMRINTLQSFPWSHRLIVFDAGDPAQLAWAIQRAGEQRPTIFLASSVDRAAGWDGWQRLVTALGQPLYVLEQRFAERLQIASVPSVFTQEGAVLRVREVGQDEVRAAKAAEAQGVASAGQH
jgi:conjugal transfer pilus assembly protein TraW